VAAAAATTTTSSGASKSEGPSPPGRRLVPRTSGKMGGSAACTPRLLLSSFPPEPTRPSVCGRSAGCSMEEARLVGRGGAGRVSRWVEEWRTRGRVDGQSPERRRHNELLPYADN